MTDSNDRLESFGIYKIACQLFQDSWADLKFWEKIIVGGNLANNRYAA